MKKEKKKKKKGNPPGAGRTGTMLYPPCYVFPQGCRKSW
jgi:hypothetical protein